MADELEATQYLTFVLDEEVFAVDVARVREILEFTTVTKIPQTQHYMRGVINLRGCVVPVIDLRVLFGLPDADATVNTCIVVIEINTDGNSMIVGALTDSVREVMELEGNQIEAAPRIGSRVKAGFISGMGKHNNEFIMILNIDRMLPDEASEAFAEISELEFSKEGQALAA
jgi:purine-binding chemotaxis protein CheW